LDVKWGFEKRGEKRPQRNKSLHLLREDGGIDFKHQIGLEKRGEKNEVQWEGSRPKKTRRSPIRTAVKK